MARFLLAIAFAVSLSSLVSGDESKKNANADELKNLQGTWKAVWYHDESGRKVQYDETKVQMMYTFVAQLEANMSRCCLITCDSSKTPRTADIMVAGDKDRVFTAIYKLDGDQLMLCTSPPGRMRPTHFESNPKQGQRLVLLKRLMK